MITAYTWILSVTYLAYLGIAFLLTVRVGHGLHKNGRVFLVQNFQGQEGLADSINDLLLTGFYLINIGFVTLALRYGDKPTSPAEIIEYLSMKIGAVAIVLGFMHFFNMRMLVHFRTSELFRALAPTERKALQPLA
jgi:hypothetical protein